jgi:hypothetical protein
MKDTVEEDQQLCVVVHKYIYRNVYFTTMAPVNCTRMLKCANYSILDATVPTAVCASHLRVFTNATFYPRTFKKTILGALKTTLVFLEYRLWDRIE